MVKRENLADKVTRESLLRAVEKVANESIALRPSTVYSVIINNKEYPPKAIVREAAKILGLSPDNYNLYGGKYKFLEQMGFQIVKKSNSEFFTWVETHQEIVEYMAAKENTQAELIELLKSVGISPFNDKAEAGEHDIELEEIDPFTFFCYIYKYGSQRRLKFLQAIAAKLSLEEPTDDKGLPSAQAQKVWLFPYKYERKNNEVSRLWQFFHKALSDTLIDADFDDVLTIRSTGRTKLTEALFYINPEKYLPINGPTKPYLKEELGIDPAFKTYSEYLDVLEQIRSKTDLPFYELSYEAWKWNDNRKKTNYWIFQGNPKIYDFVGAMRKGGVDTWTVSGHKDKMKVGDKAIMWLTGKNAGCYALGEITKEPYKNGPEQDEFWKEEDKSEWKAGLEMTHSLIDNPITREMQEGNDELANLKVGNQGSTFSATKEEYEILLKLINISADRNYWVYSPGENAKYWDTFHKEGILGLGWNDLGDISRFGSKDDIVEELQLLENTTSSKKNDATANWDFIHRIKVGDMIIAKKGRRELIGYGIVTSDYYYDPNRQDQHHLRRIDWKLKGVWPISHNLSLKTLTIITGFETEATDYKYYYQRLLGDMGVDVPRIKKEIMPINKILYGPPGTGKTYHLKNSLFPLYTAKENSLTREEFVSSIMNDIPWWKVIGLVLHDLKNADVSSIREHEYLIAKERVSNSTTVKQTIWGQLQLHTVDGCANVNVKTRRSPQFFFKNDDSEWSIDPEGYNLVEEDFDAINDSLMAFESANNIEIKRYEFITFHQSYAYEDFIEGIKPVMEDDSDGDIQYRIESGVFKNLCKRAEIDPNNNYAIFIDEINRGNVSSIFGELITLIEDDKRLGSENEMTATLPYSRATFGVPKNVHIYGTMNTADRSVEALDTALRRRFSFVEMLPDASKLEKKVEGLQLSELLSVLNDRIEVLVDRDHTIGHAFFMNNKTLDDLRNTFANKVIPLLQEYFYGDYGKMEMVIGSDFFKVKDTTKVKFAIKSEDFDPEGKVYHIVDIADKTVMSDEALKDALNKLIKGA